MFGLIGAGRWGTNILREMNEYISTVCDVNVSTLETIAKEYPDITTTTDVYELFAHSSAVVIATPATSHFVLTKRALERGLHCFVEKPFCLNSSEAKELTKLAKKKRRVLMVGHILHYNPAIQTLLAVSKQRIGQIISISTTRLQSGCRDQSVLWGLAPHDISIILRICGGEMSTSEITYHNDTSFTIKLNYPTKTATIFIDSNARDKSSSLTIVGTCGMCHYDGTTVFLHTPGQVCTIPFETTMTPLQTELYHFIDCCRTNTTPITDGEEGVRVTMLLEALDRVVKPVVITDKQVFIHPTAIVDEGAIIRKGTKIWHFSHICAGAHIGENCVIGQNVYIGPDVSVGHGCKVQNSVSLYTGVTVGNDVFIGPGAVFTNDLTPRAAYPKDPAKRIQTYIENGATIGANATIICGNRIGEGAFVAAAATVTHDVSSWTLVEGTPARVVGSVNPIGNITRTKST